MAGIRRAIRCIQTVAVECPRLTRFTLQAPKSVEVEYDNGSVYSLSAEYLRIYSPAVDSKIRSVGGEKIQHVLEKGYIWAASCGNHVCRTYRELWDCYLMTCIRLGSLHGITSIILGLTGSL